MSLFINLFISPVTVLERFRVTGWLASRLEPQLVGVTDRLMRPASFSERSGVSAADYDRLRAECFWAMRNGELRGHLSRIKAPGLVIWGMEDNSVSLRDASILAMSGRRPTCGLFPGPAIGRSLKKLKSSSGM